MYQEVDIELDKAPEILRMIMESYRKTYIGKKEVDPPFHSRAEQFGYRIFVILNENGVVRKYDQMKLGGTT